jgi:hypothetical protein
VSIMAPFADAKSKPYIPLLKIINLLDYLFIDYNEKNNARNSAKHFFSPDR